MASVSEPSTRPQTFIELLDNENEWFVRVVEDGRETVSTFSTEWFAIVFAQEERLRLGVTEVRRV